MFKFDYLRPKTLKEACEILKKYKEKSRVIAGGTDLLIQIREKDKRFKDIDFIVDISHIQKELKYINEDEKYIHIGALSTHTDIEVSDILNKYVPFLSKASASVGSTQIRNLGTIGGSICNASPAADPLTPLIALDAYVLIVSDNGTRTQKLKDIYEKAGKLSLEYGEIIKEFYFEKPQEGTKTNFIKLGRRKALAISRLNSSVMVNTDSEENIIFARIAPGCIFQVPDRVEVAEKLLIGKKPSYELFTKVGEKVSEEMIERTGIRWSTEYKKPAIEAIVKRSLLECFNMPYENFAEEGEEN